MRELLYWADENLGLIFLVCGIICACYFIVKRNNYLKKAKSCLDEIREGHILSSCKVIYMDEYLEKAFSSREQIGTSDKEINEMLHQYNLDEAKKYLDKAREEGISTRTYIEFVDDYLKSTNSNYADIGTSKEEVENLRKQI